MTKTIKPIRNEDQLEGALKRIGDLLDCMPDTPDAEELEVLSLVVKAYEDKHHPIPPPDPIDMIRFLMDQHSLKPKDLADVFGTSGRTSEVLQKQRPLTLPMIRKLSTKFGVSADSLISEYSCVG